MEFIGVKDIARVVITKKSANVRGFYNPRLSVDQPYNLSYEYRETIQTLFNGSNVHQFNRSAFWLSCGCPAAQGYDCLRRKRTPHHCRGPDAHCGYSRDYSHAGHCL